MRRICFFIVAIAACLIGFTIVGHTQTVQHSTLRNSVFLGEPLEIQTTISGLNAANGFKNYPLVDTGKQWFLASAITIDSVSLPQTVVIKYQVVCFDSGDVELVFTKGLLHSGSSIGSSTSSPASIKVLPVPIAGMKQLHPAEPLLVPKKPEPTIDTWLVVVVASALLAVLFLVFWWRNKKASTVPKTHIVAITPSYETLLTQQPATIDQWQQWAADVYVLLHHEFPTLKNITASKNWPAQVPSSLQGLYQQISALLFAKAIPNSTPQQLLQPLIAYIKQKNN